MLTLTDKSILKSKNDEPPMYRRTGPPEFLLDTESYERDKGNDMMPSSLINLIRSVKYTVLSPSCPTCTNNKQLFFSIAL